MAKIIWFTCPRCGWQLKLPAETPHPCSNCAYFPMSVGRFKVNPRATMPLPPPTPSGSFPPPGPYPSGPMPPLPPPAPRPTFEMQVRQSWAWYRRQSRNVQVIFGSVVVVILLVICVAGTSAVAQSNNRYNATATAEAITQATASAPKPTPTPGTPTPTPTPKPTPTPTPKPKWTTIQHFAGDGNKKTGYFDVPGNWRIVWTCDHSSFSGYDYNVQVSVYDGNGPVDLFTVNAICKKDNLGDQTDEHTGPDRVYLEIDSEAKWTVDVQVLK